MGKLTVTQPGMQTQIQAAGRHGLAFYAIPPSGPLDPPAASLANELLENYVESPTIECHFVPPTLRFETDAVICLTGADMQWTVDNQPVDRFRTLEVSHGSLLSGRSAQDGCRAYIGVHGYIETSETFGSAACHALAGFGGNDGRVLALSLIHI